MNEPIISPWIFYVIGTLDGFCILFLVVSLVCLALGFIVYDEYKEDKFKLPIKFWVVSLISLFLFIFTPAQRTAERMLIAHYCTPNTIQQISDKIEISTTKLIEMILQGRKAEKTK